MPRCRLHVRLLEAGILAAVVLLDSVQDHAGGEALEVELLRARLRDPLLDEAGSERLCAVLRGHHLVPGRLPDVLVVDRVLALLPEGRAGRRGRGRTQGRLGHRRVAAVGGGAPGRRARAVRCLCGLLVLLHRVADAGDHVVVWLAEVPLGDVAEEARSARWSDCPERLDHRHVCIPVQPLPRHRVRGERRDLRRLLVRPWAPGARR
eukprot:15470281-Alexandrium_andersonii.AAC.1